MIKTRRAILLDTGSMATLLNAIILEGGSTAITRPVTAEDIREWMDFDPDRSSWHVALDDAESVQGFQWIEPRANLPTDACDIATFVKIGKTGLGIGSALFEGTRKAAARLGYSWINANIRADNEGGLIYYQSRGFRIYDRIEGYPLGNGLVVDKILKRFDLR